MQNPIGFDLGTIGGPSCRDECSAAGRGRHWLNFYVVVGGDLNMPEFITRRIIMSYKNWQSQIGPRTSSLAEPSSSSSGPRHAVLHSRCFPSAAPSFSEHETFVFDIGEQKSIWISKAYTVYTSVCFDKFLLSCYKKAEINDVIHVLF